MAWALVIVALTASTCAATVSATQSGRQLQPEPGAGRIRAQEAEAKEAEQSSYDAAGRIEEARVAAQIAPAPALWRASPSDERFPQKAQGAVQQGAQEALAEAHAAQAVAAQRARRALEQLQDTARRWKRETAVGEALADVGRRAAEAAGTAEARRAFEESLVALSRPAAAGGPSVQQLAEEAQRAAGRLEEAARAAARRERELAAELRRERRREVRSQAEEAERAARGAVQAALRLQRARRRAGLSEQYREGADARSERLVEERRQRAERLGEEAEEAVERLFDEVERRVAERSEGARAEVARQALEVRRAIEAAKARVLRAGAAGGEPAQEAGEPQAGSNHSKLCGVGAAGSPGGAPDPSALTVDRAWDALVLGGPALLAWAFAAMSFVALWRHGRRCPEVPPLLG